MSKERKQQVEGHQEASTLSQVQTSSVATTSTNQPATGVNFGCFRLPNEDSGSNGLGFGTQNYDPDEMIRTLSKIGVRPPRPFNPKKDKNFDNWLSRIEYHFALMGLSEDRATAALLLQLDPDALEIAKYLGITPEMPYKDAVTRLKDHSALTETPEESRERLTEAVHFARVSEMATRVARVGKTSAELP